MLSSFCRPKPKREVSVYTVGIYLYEDSFFKFFLLYFIEINHVYKIIQHIISQQV